MDSVMIGNNVNEKLGHQSVVLYIMAGKPKGQKGMNTFLEKAVEVKGKVTTQP